MSEIAARTDPQSRDSTFRISEATPLLWIAPRPRGCVSQTISDEGNESRSAATAGNVCTMSPSDPNRTTRSRGSGMRRLAHSFDKSPRRMILRVAYDRDANSEPRSELPLGHGVLRIIGALRMYVRPQQIQQRLDI